MGWPKNPRPAKSLTKLKDQLKTLYPDRSIASDGLIADSAHAAQGNSSDHNGWVVDRDRAGVVTAFDITHDPANGVDIAQLSGVLVKKRDARIKYLIRNGEIMVSPDWFWQPYAGDPHTNHLHLSVKSDQINYDNEAPWSIVEEGELEMTPEVKAVLEDLKQHVLDARKEVAELRSVVIGKNDAQISIADRVEDVKAHVKNVEDKK